VSAYLPAWQEINWLFAKHGLAPPPTRLRDELVAHLIAHRGQSSEVLRPQSEAKPSACTEAPDAP
jgi:hypothetical protein